MGVSTFVDKRNTEPHSGKVFKYTVDTLTVPDGTHAVEQVTTFNANGTIRQVSVAINDNTGNATATIEIRDAAGAILWTEAAIAENATAVFQYNTRSATDLPLAILCAGVVTVGCLASGDPGASGLIANVIVWGD